MPMIEVYCDGSVTNAVMVDVFTSAIGNEYVGRAMVLVPALDFGLIEQTQVGMVTMRGQPASNEAEVFAIRSALKVCGALSIADHVVYNDCQGAVARFTSDRVEWRCREEMYLPNSYFDKVLGRASYLRATTKKVTKRKPAEAHQIEIFRLFQSPRREFKLSESPLWARVSRDAARHDRALGLTEKRAKPGNYMSGQGEEEFEFVPAYSWFGKFNPNPFLCRGEPIPTPVGTLCMDCNEPFVEDSHGMAFPSNAGAEDSRSTHFECFIRTIPAGDPEP
jgi:hypothetical protein